MPRESTVSYEQVAAIAERIKAEGGKPSQRSVRERLGHGSMGTIHGHLQNWKAGRAVDSPASLSLPPLLQRAILDHMQVSLAEARTGLEMELAESRQTANDLAAENERLESRIDHLQDQLAGLTGEKDTLQGKVAQLEKDLGTSRDDCARERQSGELARTELAKAQLRLEPLPRLEKDLVDLREQLRAMDKAREEATHALAVSRVQIDSAQARVATLLEEKVSQEARDRAAIERLEQERGDLQTSLRECAGRAGQLQGEVEALRARSAK